MHLKRLSLVTLLALLCLHTSPAAAEELEDSGRVEPRSNWCYGYKFTGLSVPMNVVGCASLAPGKSISSSARAMGVTGAVGQYNYWMRVEVRETSGALETSASGTGQILTSGYAAPGTYRGVCVNASGYTNAIQCGVR